MRGEKKAFINIFVLLVCRALSVTNRARCCYYTLRFCTYERQAPNSQKEVEESLLVLKFQLTPRLEIKPGKGTEQLGLLREPRQEARRDPSRLPPAPLGTGLGLAPCEQKLPKENHLCEQRTKILPVPMTLLLPVEMGFLCQDARYTGSQLIY